MAVFHQCLSAVFWLFPQSQTVVTKIWTKYNCDVFSLNGMKRIVAIFSLLSCKITLGWKLHLNVEFFLCQQRLFYFSLWLCKMSSFFLHPNATQYLPEGNCSCDPVCHVQWCANAFLHDTFDTHLYGWICLKNHLLRATKTCSPKLRDFFSSLLFHHSLYCDI